MVKWQGEIKRPEVEVVVVGGNEEIVSRRTTLILSMGSFALSVMFLLQNITGNVVANFSTNGANWFGAIFFILAIAGFFVYVRKMK
ncbi:MAG: hypothetical protein ABIF18_00590 [archaeon]